MLRTITLSVTGVVMATTLSACGGDSAYCASVKKDLPTLESFGTKRTDASFGTYAKVARELSKDAPADVKKDWSTIANATYAVIKAHRAVGIALEDMKDPAKLAALSTADRATIQKSYDRFNQSRTPRKAVVTSIKTECKITLT